jgi:Uri superfamily endonuclease
VKGIYVLVVSVCRDIKVSLGALGDVFFEKGMYAYVGSAQNCLEKRVKRHLGKAKRKFWHIDYLLDSDAAMVKKVFCKEAGKSEECRIARKLNERGVAVKNFGCSDCSCVSHLFRVKDYGFLSEFMFEIKL